MPTLQGVIIMKNIISYLIAISIFLLSLTASWSQDEEAQTDLQKYVNFLSSTEMQGVAPGSIENIKAGDFIESKFKEFGLQTVNNSFKQGFDFDDTLNLGKKNNVTFKILIRKPGVPVEMLRARKKHWTVSKDWMPMRFSKNATADGQIVFCGYGISAKDEGYDDYKDVDANGKIVIILTDSAEGRPLDDFFTPYSDLKTKVENAEEHGAIAVIFAKVQHDSANTFYDFTVDRNYTGCDIPVIQANRTMIAKLFPKKSPLLKIERKINENKKPNSFLLPDVSVEISVDVEKVQKQLNNIVGLVKGRDANLQNEYIIVGSHFDGFGAYWYKPKWHPKEWRVLFSADANASGVSIMLDLAKKIAQNPLKRSILFIGFNGGTIGQLGSNYYVNHQLIPLEKTVFMLDLDMVGRMRNNRLFVFGSGSGTNFNDVLRSAVRDSTTQLIPAINTFAKSDEIPFYKNDIPVMMLFTGNHRDYKTFNDTPDKLNYDGMETISDIANNIINQIANNDSKPNFQLDPSVTDFKKVKKGYLSWLGIVPDYEPNLNGLIVSDVFRFSPAEKAHIKQADIITTLEGRKVRNCFDLKSILSLKKPGDIVELKILRNGKEKKVKVKLRKSE